MVAIVVSGAAGCSSGIPKSALEMNPQTVENRQLQTRRFDTTAEGEVLSACAALLQDLGFGLDESETKLGLIAGSKDRDATEAGQVIGSALMGVLFGVYTPVDDHQKIRASIVTRPVGPSVNVRVTFQRAVWNTQGQISRLEMLDEPEMYEGFFDRLSKAVFLEAHEL